MSSPRHRLLAVCLFLAGLCLALPVGARGGEPIGDQILRADATWEGTVRVRGVFVVGRGATLTIRPGTTVLFEKIDSNRDGIGDSELRVLGRLLAEGTPAAPIRFQSAETAPAPKDWSYVLFYTSSAVNRLRHCEFRHAFTGLQVHFSTAFVSDSRFTDNHEGIRFGRARLTLEHNAVSGNHLGVRFTRMEGPVQMRANVISGNGVGIFLVPSGQNIIDFFEPGRTGKPWNEGHLAIEANTIAGNLDYDLNLGEKQKWDLAVGGNWWGTPDPAAIGSKIFDQKRDAELGQALIQPVLAAPPPQAGPRPEMP